MSASNIDIAKINQVVQKCCKTTEECSKCAQGKCLIGFAKIALEYAEKKNVVSIAKGGSLVPTGDYKIYYQEDLINALVEVLSQCQDCQDNHENDCIINIIRMSLETALLGENIPYEGSAFGYLMQVLKKDSTIGQKLLDKFKNK
ncbi:hypothetical protein RDV78_07485 [Bacillota bacterium LX-D]|nr:hypothetical protein [Bacillota bacterium LX-D]